MKFQEHQCFYSRTKQAERFLAGEGRGGTCSIVIFTGDVEKAEGVFKAGCLTLRMEQVFVRNIPGEEIYQKICQKIQDGEELTEREQMQMIILPLAEKGKAGKQRRIRQAVEQAEQIRDEEVHSFVLAGLLTASDKFIDREFAEKVRRHLRMNKVLQIIDEEAREDERKKFAKKLIEENVGIPVIMRVTGFSEEMVREIGEDMLAAQ